MRARARINLYVYDTLKKYASWQYTKIAYFRHKNHQLASIPTSFEYKPPVVLLEVLY